MQSAAKFLRWHRADKPNAGSRWGRSHLVRRFGLFFNQLNCGTLHISGISCFILSLGRLSFLLLTRLNLSFPQNEIFASRHQDVNSVACIEDKCYVLTLAQYCR